MRDTNIESLTIDNLRLLPRTTFTPTAVPSIR